MPTVYRLCICKKENGQLDNYGIEQIEVSDQFVIDFPCNEKLLRVNIISNDGIPLICFYHTNRFALQCLNDGMYTVIVEGPKWDEIFADKSQVLYPTDKQCVVKL